MAPLQFLLKVGHETCWVCGRELALIRQRCWDEEIREERIQVRREAYKERWDWNPAVMCNASRELQLEDEERTERGTGEGSEAN